MRHYFTIPLFLALFLLPLFNAVAQVAPPPALAVKAYLLKDFNSGTIIVSSNKDNRIEPASLTKIMAT